MGRPGGGQGGRNVHGDNRPAGRTHPDGQMNKGQGGGSHHNDGK
jgi:hypothetical protein